MSEPATPSTDKQREAMAFGEELAVLLRQQAESDTASMQVTEKLSKRVEDLERFVKGGMLSTPADRDLVKALAAFALLEVQAKSHEACLHEMFLPTLEKSLKASMPVNSLQKGEHLLNLIKLCGRAHRTPFLPEQAPPGMALNERTTASGLILPGQTG